MTARIVYGSVDGGYKVRVSKAGYDVLTATGTDLIFDSDSGNLRIVQSGQTTILEDVSSATIPITGLGSGQAFAMVSVHAPDGFANTLFLGFYLSECRLTTTTLYLTKRAAVLSQELTFSYTILGY